tara:strand:- start:43 stop:1137 length:1095 start_codon:yes stop_codon:yes gene_type:complete
MTRAVTNRVAIPERKFPPLIINGDMKINQRGTVTGITTPGKYTLDRIRADIRGGFGVQVAQSTDVPSGYGFSNSLKLDVTTADGSPDANGLLLLGYHFEGSDLQFLKYGTSSAETTTIAFWIKSNKTGTFQVNLRMVEAYHIGQLVTISSADTWEKKVITFVGNTANAHANDSSSEMRIQFFFDSGSDSGGGGVPSAWANVSETKSYNGSIDLGDSTDNEVLITGLQMEVGDYNVNTLPSFQFENFGTSLARCQRYCIVYGTGEESFQQLGETGISTSTTQAQIPFNHPTEMRGVPTLSNSGNLALGQGTALVAMTAVAINTNADTRQSTGVIATVSSGLTAHKPYRIDQHSSSSSIMIFEAEL